MRDILKVLNSHRPKSEEEQPANERNQLRYLMGFKVLKPYYLESIYQSSDKASSLDQMYSFEDLIIQSWEGQNFFEVFVNKLQYFEQQKDGPDLNDQKSQKSQIVEIQINKSTLNGQPVKLFLVRSIDFLVHQQTAVMRMKREQRHQMLLSQALDEHLNILNAQSRILLDDTSLIKKELKSISKGSDSTILHQIWGHGKILEYLIQASRGRKRF